MHKKMCNQLMRLEKNGMHVMQREKIHHTKRLTVLKNSLCEIDQRIYYNKILNNRWDRLKTTHPDI